MENKVYNHVARHKVSYLVAAVLVMVGGLSVSSTRSVPDFTGLNNKAFTGNVGDLATATVTSPVTFMEQNLASKVATSGEKMTIQWQNNSNGPVTLYLVPANPLQKAIKLQTVSNKSGVSSYTLTVPDSVATGNYSFGISAANGRLAKTEAAFAIVNSKGTNAATAIQTSLNTLATSVSSSKAQLANVTAQITAKNQEVSKLEQQLQLSNNSLNASVSRYQQLRTGTVSATAYKAATQEISTLSNQVAKQKLAVQEAKTGIVTLEAQAKTLEATIAMKELTVASLEQKMTELKTNSEMNLNSSVTANNNAANSSVTDVTGAQAGVSNNLTLADLTAQMEAKKGEIASLNEQFAAATSEAAAARLEVSNSEIALNQATARVSELTVSLEQAQARVSDVSAKMARTNDAAAKVTLEQDLKTAQNEVSSTEALLITAKNDSEAAAQRLSTGKRINSAKDDASNQMQVSISNLQAELDAVTAKYNILQQASYTNGVSANGSAVTNGVSVSNEISNGVSNNTQMNTGVSNSITSDSGVSNGVSVTDELSVTNGVSNNVQMNGVTTTVTAQ